MAVRDASFPIALIGSIALHLLLLSLFARAFRTPAAVMKTLPDSWAAERNSPEAVDTLGNQDTAGRATDSSPGEESQQARLNDQEQALLSLDPAGSGKTREPQTPSPSPPGAMRSGRPASLSERIKQLTDPAERLEKIAFGLPEAARLAEPYRPRHITAGTDELHPLNHPAIEEKTEPAESTGERDPVAAPQQTAEPVRAEMNAAPPGTPVSAETSAAPIPQGKTESDAFSQEANIDVRPGKVIARTGRPHRITRPRDGLAGTLDAFSYPGMTLTLRLRLSATGDVTDASVVRSSGSNSIDQPWKVAAYKWWFEPKKNEMGQAIEDSMQLTLRFL